MFFESTRDLWDGIPNEIREKAINNIIKNLDKIGIYEGHVISRHAGKSEEFLNQRLDNYPNLKVVSSFYNKNIAEVAIKKALTKSSNKEIIREWLNTIGFDLELEAIFKNSLGIFISKENRKVEESKTLKIILEKTNSTDYGFRVKTAFLKGN